MEVQIETMDAHTLRSHRVDAPSWSTCVVQIKFRARAVSEMLQDVRIQGSQPPPAEAMGRRQLDFLQLLDSMHILFRNTSSTHSFHFVLNILLRSSGANRVLVLSNDKSRV
jgi:hypothetical protein